MDEPSYEIHSSEKPPEKWLDSWKEIAAYLNRDVTTVQRWEKREGMPVHRHVHDKRGSVYALPEELDEWIRSRKASVDEPEKKPEAEMPPAAPSGDGDVAGRRARLWVGVAAVLCICLMGAGWLITRHRETVTAEPKIRSLAVLPSAEPIGGFCAGLPG